jgi:hypothetical protein
MAEVPSQHFAFQNYLKSKAFHKMFQVVRTGPWAASGGRQGFEPIPLSSTEIRFATLLAIGAVRKIESS